MKKWIAAALFLCAAAVSAQSWTALPNAWVRIDGGAIVPAGGGGVEPYSGTPVLGDIIYFDGTNWVSLPVGSNTNVLTLAAGIPSWAAPAAAGGAVSLQGAYPGTPDTGNANVTGTIGSTRNNLHATLGNFGLSLENNQAALVGQTQEYSPGIRLLGAAWDVDGAVSDTNAWQILAKPVSANTTSIDLSFNASLAGGAYAQKALLSSAGKLTLGESGASVGALQLYNATSGSITIQPTTGALGTVTLTAPATSGTILQTGTDVTLAQIVPASAASVLLGRGSAAGAGDFQEVTLGSGLTMTNQVLAGMAMTRSNYYYFNDFTCRAASATTACGEMTAFDSAGTSAGWKTTQPPTALVDGTLVGVNEITTGTSSTGSAVIGTQWDTVLISGGEIIEWRIYIPTLSTDADTFKIWAGLCDASGSSDCVDGLYFTLDSHPTGGDTHWIINTANNSARTQTATNLVATAAAWHVLRIEVNAGATSIAFKVDGTEVNASPLAANIPTGAGRQTSLMLKAVSSLSGNAKVVDVDYAMLYKPGLSR